MTCIDRSQELYDRLVGKTFPAFEVLVTHDRVAGYARSIGDNDPIRQDTAAARAAGYRDIVAPPTFGFTITLLAAQSNLALGDLGFDMNEALHGEQLFEYGAPICAGDLIRGVQVIESVEDKKGGALLFVKSRFDLNNQDREWVLGMVQTSIIQLETAE